MATAIGNKLIIELLEKKESTSKAGLYLGSKSKERPGKVLSKGKRCSLEVDEGTLVTLFEHGGSPIKLDGKDCVVIHEEGIAYIN